MKGTDVWANVWDVLAREEVFAARPYVAVARERIRTPAGVIVDGFYEVELASFALCVPVAQDGRIVTLWEYKHGPRRYGLGFPAGFVEPNEDADVACRRELREETGYVAEALVPLGKYVDNGNQRGSMGHYFVAHGCERVGDPVIDDLETGEVRLMTPDAIDAALADGDFAVVHHVAAWGLARARLS